MEPHRSRARWTYSEFARLPTSGSTRAEVVDGELVVTPAPGRRHQRVVTDLATLLNTHVRAHGLGEVFAGPFDVLFAEGDYLEPDLVFVRADRLHLLSDRGVEGAPDLVVEVLSPSTVERDRGVKLERYQHYGVPEYWIVDPEARAIEVWRLTEAAARPEVVRAGEVLRWQALRDGPALELEVAEVLREG